MKNVTEQRKKLIKWFLKTSSNPTLLPNCPRLGFLPANQGAGAEGLEEAGHLGGDTETPYCPDSKLENEAAAVPGQSSSDPPHQHTLRCREVIHRPGLK